MREAKINENGKIELYFDYEDFQNLDSDVKKEVKSRFNWSRYKKAWISKAKKGSYHFDFLLGKIQEWNFRITENAEELTAEEKEEKAEEKRESSIKYYAALAAESRKEGKTNFSIEDIPESVAYHAHTNTSFSPRKRAKQDREGYVAQLERVYSELSKYAKDDYQKDILEVEFGKFKEKFLDLYLKYLHSRSRLASSFVTGGSGFPVRQQEKYRRWSDNHFQRYLEFAENRPKLIKNKLKKARSAASVLQLESLPQVEKIKSDIEFIHKGYADEKKGIPFAYDKNLLKNSIANRIFTVAKNIGLKYAHQILMFDINTAKKYKEKRLFTLRHKVWKFLKENLSERELAGDFTNQEKEKKATFTKKAKEKETWTISEEKLRLLLRSMIGNFGNLYKLSGNHNKENRRKVIEYITSEITPLAKAGISRLEKVIYNYLGIEGNTIAEKETQFKNWLEGGDTKRAKTKEDEFLPEETNFGDSSEISQLKDSINEGILILKTGKFNGRKLSELELEQIRRSVRSSKNKLQSKLFPVEEPSKIPSISNIKLNVKRSVSEMTSPLDVIMIAPFNIKTNEALFQGRLKLNLDHVKEIVENFEPYKFDPIVVNENMEILSGHHRFEAARRLKLKEIPLRIFKGNLTKQKEFAKFSNFGQLNYSDVEISKIINEDIKKGTKLSDLEIRYRLSNRELNTIRPLQSLIPELQGLYNDSKAKPYIQSFARVMQKNNDFSNSKQSQFFKLLKNSEIYELTPNKFEQIISTIFNLKTKQEEYGLFAGMDLNMNQAIDGSFVKNISEFKKLDKQFSDLENIIVKLAKKEVQLSKSTEKDVRSLQDQLEKQIKKLGLEPSIVVKSRNKKVKRVFKNPYSYCVAYGDNICRKLDGNN
jgi:hypothetical protein